MIRSLSLILLLLVVIVAGFLCWVAATEGGLRWAIGFAETSLAGKLAVNRVSGTLLNRVELDDVRYEDQGQVIKASRIALNWNPWALKMAELNFSSLRIHQLDINLPEAPKDTAAPKVDSPLSGLSLPFSLSLADAQIDGIRIVSAGSLFEIEQLRLDARFDSNQLEIARFAVDSETLKINLDGRIEATSPYRHDFSLRWQATLPSARSVNGEGRLMGDLAATRLTQTTQGLLQLALDLELFDPLDQLSWQASIVTDSIDMMALDSSLPALQAAFNLNAKGDLESAVVSGRMDASAPQLGPFRADFELRSLAGEQRYDGVYVNSLKLTALDTIVSASGQFDWLPAPNWKALARVSGLNPAQWLSEWPGNFDAEIATTGRFDQDQLHASVDITRLEGKLRNYPVSLQSKLRLNGEDIDIDSFDFHSGDTRVSARGRVGDQLALDWSLKSTDLAELYPGAIGHLQASGRLEGKREKPRLKASFKGKSLGLPDYQADVVDGTVSLDLLHWQQFDISLTAQGLTIQDYRLNSLNLTSDTQRINARASTDDVTVELELAGKFNDQSWRGQITRANLESTEFSRWQLKSPAALNLALDSVDAEKFCLQGVDANEICAAITGREQSWQLNAEASKIQLAMLDKFITSDVKPTGLANARASLEYRAPDLLLGRVEVDLPAAAVSYPLRDDQPDSLDYDSGRLDLWLEPTGIRATAKLTLAEGNIVDARVELPAATLIGLDLEKQALQGDLRLKLEDLAIVDSLLEDVDELQGKVDIEMTVAGTLAAPRLQGRFNLVDAGLSIPALELKLTQVNFSGHTESLEKFVYTANARTLDADVTLTGHTLLNQVDGWPSEMSANATGLDLSKRLTALLPAELKIEGRFDTSAKLRFQAPDNLTGDIKLTSTAGKFSYPLLRGEREVWDYRDASVEMLATPRGVEASWAVAAGGGNSLSGRLELPLARLMTLRFAEQVLRANASLDFQELKLIEALVPEIDQLQGKMALEVEASGTLAQPKLSLRTEISDASLRIPRLGLRIDRISLNGATQNDGRFGFKLAAYSDQGGLNIEGISSLDAAAGWPTSIQVKGENFEISRIPEARVTVSPDLTVTLANRAIDIQGEILVPYARLQPKDISTAVRVSSDTVVIGDDQPTESPWSLTTRIRLVLGERVSFYGFGFEGNLGGNLLIEDSPGQLTRGTGTISILTGRYRAYGQRLDVENGRLLFSGGPITNPGLDLRAVRRSGTIVSGIDVTGQLENPRLELFSIPAMGQTDMLSYLLLGRPMEGASGTEGAMMAQAALALGVVGGDRLSRTLGERFGLDEVRVESDDTGDQASLVVGRYLTPKLYVSYGVGLIESFNTLNLRYQISDKWQLEAASGESQGADLLYSIER